MKKLIFFIMGFVCASLSTWAQQIPRHSISGIVLSAKDGTPLVSATVKIKNTILGTTTDSKGHFSLQDASKRIVLIISSLGYATQEIIPGNKKNLTIRLQPSVNKLDETVIRAYGTTTWRLNTGSIGKVTAKEIERQPVSNPLAALEGRVPGLVVTESSGVPGAAFKVQIRGQNSISQGSDPLFIIDGVPFAPGNTSLNQITSTVGEAGLSPFNSINPSDIASIEILKDADATAIYGSRGANGVVLITTKKGQPGKTKITVNVNTGISNVTRMMPMMNTKQYLMMREEAFKNDGVTPDVNNAPDLLVWDTTRYTNFEKLLIGGTAHTTNAQVSISGGNEQTQFLLSGGYNHQTTVFPGNLKDNRGSVHINLNHKTKNNKFRIQLSTIYSSDVNNLNSGDLTAYINMPPDFPALRDSVGKLTWGEKGISYSNLGLINPLSYLDQPYKAITDNLLSDLQMSYKISSPLTCRINMGYNNMQIGETNLLYSSSFDPEYDPTGILNISSVNTKDWIIEPQIEYIKNMNFGKVDILVGSTWEQNVNCTIYVQGTGYTSDDLLNSLGAASDIYAQNSYDEYRYEAVFARINYVWKDKYIIDIAGRRDGSSRFGPGKRWADFGSAAFAWLFSEEKFMKRTLPFLSYGKLRASYGTTGNDQIGDYQYLDSWSSNFYSYQGEPTLHPVRLYNPDYSWEINKKLDVGMELGVLYDRILLTADYFKNRCGNQLISYYLPIQTGFNSIISNFNAIVQNQGWEFLLNTQNITKRNFKWTSNLAITLPQNKLVSFPGLAFSSYSQRYVVGKSLNVIKGYELLGVDPATGNYKFRDVNQDGQISYPYDYVIIGNTDPRLYGSLQNEIDFKNWSLNFTFEFKDQMGKNYLAYQSDNALPPGFYYNQPVIALGRWQHKGDKTNIARFTQTFGGDVYLASVLDLPASSGVYGDASYVRLKNVSLGYNIPLSFTKKIHVSDIHLYLNMQNLLLITGYKGSDPETQNLYTLPPLKTATAGIQFTF